MNNDARNRPIESTGIGAIQMPALIVGILGMIGCVIGFMSNKQEFFRSYLPAYIFWFSIAAGSLGLLMLQYVTGGEWGVLIRRPLGAAARSLFLPLAILFLPIAFGVHEIYIWANHHVMDHNPLLKVKEPYLNPTAWYIRAAVLFGIWTLWSYRLKAHSREFEATRSPESALKRRRWAAPGILVMVFALTFASIDWLMSLEPLWFSSMFGISFTVGCGLAALAFMTLLVARLSKSEAMADVLKPGHLRDLGNLMLAFTMLWAYTAFSQFLLIWYANLKEEVPYYLKRMHGGWGIVALILILFHFFAPFFMLLMRAIKDRPQTIQIVAGLLLVMRFVDLFWLTAPAYSEHFHFSWMILASFAAVGGIWLWAFVGALKGQTIIPVHESWVEQAYREGALKTNA
jgi:hypothetical protein